MESTHTAAGGTARVDTELKLISFPCMRKCDRCSAPEGPRRHLKRAIWAHPTDYKKPVLETWWCLKCRRNSLQSSHPPAGYETYNWIPAGMRLSSYQIEEILYLNGLGLSADWIASETGCSRTTVWRVIERQMAFHLHPALDRRRKRGQWL